MLRMMREYSCSDSGACVRSAYYPTEFVVYIIRCLLGITGKAGKFRAIDGVRGDCLDRERV